MHASRKKWQNAGARCWHSVSHWWHQSVTQKWSMIHQFDACQSQTHSVRPVVLIWCCYNSSCPPCFGSLVIQLDKCHRALEAINFLAHNFAKCWPLFGLLCYGTIVLSVCNVGVLWPNDRMDQYATWYGGRLEPRLHCVRCGSSSPPGKGA